MKKVVFIIIFFYSFIQATYAEQVQTKFKFRINVPNSYIHIKTDLNFDQLSKKYKNKEVDMNYLRQLSREVGGNMMFEIIIHENLSPGENSINLNKISGAGAVIDEYKKLQRSELCNYLQSELSTMLKGKNVRQNYCDFIGKINYNISEVFKLIHEGWLPNQKLIQYQFQFRDDLFTATLNCLKENCDFMDQDLTQILKSIQ